MIEALVIRFLWVLHALKPRKMPGLCPPQCDECHTFRFPCRARIKNAPIASYLARPKLHQRPKERQVFFGFDGASKIGDIEYLEQTDYGVLVTGTLTDPQVEQFREILFEKRLYHSMYP